MNYGFIIDNRSCIGCHACSTACKQENEVPLGVYRTWVKYVDKGVFPSVRRTFQVTRCNHCANPPCVRICPVTAMYQRHDGIVEFDPDVCIGCKACLQACPYDAIYIDPDSGTAAKCHYCSHRTDIGLEPACVVVCPTQAIIAGDIDDPASRISQLLARETVTVRKPEQGTAPKLFYIDGDAIALTPTAAGAGGTFAFADVVGAPAPSPRPRPKKRLGAGEKARSGVDIRQPGPQGMGSWQGPIQIGEGTMAEHMVQVSYNAQHKLPWHWQVPAYLVTKAVGSGVPLVLALRQWYFGGGFIEPLYAAWLVLAALIFTGLTAVLLVADLEKPGRFYFILTRPQWKSWLTRGAFILLGHTLVLIVWLAAILAPWLGWSAHSAGGVLPGWLLAIGVVSSMLTAAYTGFLFAQAEGRDLWQSPLLPVHLVVQALVAGAAMVIIGTMKYAIFEPYLPRQPTMGDGPYVPMTFLSLVTLCVALIVDAVLILWGEFGIPHASESAARAAHEIVRGRYRHMFWWGAIVLGHVVPLAIGVYWLATNAVTLPAIVLVVTGAVLAIVGLFLYEYAYVMAPQEVPNS